MTFVGKFFLLVTVVGFAELYLLVEVATRLSFPVTLGLCVLTGVVGGALVRYQGLRTLTRVQRALSRGELPAEQIVGGVVLLMVGATLILPGFVSDTVGFALLVPPVRERAAARLVRHFEGKVQVFHGKSVPFGDAPSARPPPGRAEVIDVEPDPANDQR